MTPRQRAREEARALFREVFGDPPSAAYLRQKRKDDRIINSADPLCIHCMRRRQVDAPYCGRRMCRVVGEKRKS